MYLCEQSLKNFFIVHCRQDFLIKDDRMIISLIGQWYDKCIGQSTGQEYLDT